MILREWSEGDRVPLEWSDIVAAPASTLRDAAQKAARERGFCPNVGGAFVDRGEYRSRRCEESKEEKGEHDFSYLIPITVCAV